MNFCNRTHQCVTMKRTTIILVVLLSLPFGHGWGVAAQNPDSLYTIWQDVSLPDSVRVTAYKDYIWNGYLFSKPDTAAELAEALHNFAKKQNYPMAAATGHNLQGVVNYIKGNYPLALKYYYKSLAIFEEIGDKKGIAGSLGNIGPMYKFQGNYLRALEYYQKSLAIFEEIGDKRGIAGSLNNIGGIYFDQGNYPRALEYRKKSLAISEEIGDKRFLAASLNNIGNIYKNQGNYPGALEYYEKSLAIKEELGDKRGIASSLGSLGLIYRTQDNFPLSLEYYEKSLAIMEEIGNKNGIAGILSSIGSVYQKQGKNTLALDNCHKGLALAVEIGAIEWQREAYQCLYTTYKAMGNGYEALVYLEQLREVEDSLSAQETTKKLEQMEFAKVMLQDSILKAEEARLVEEAHQAEVRKRNQARNSAYVGGFIALILAGGFYSRWRYVRKSRDIISKEKDRSDNLLLNILPAEIAAELKEKGRADARDFDMVSILFTDFKSFTEQSAKLSAQDLVSEINACFEAFDGIMSKFGIEKIKTIGDAYMAAGGLPVPSDDSAKNTVLAALEMQSFIIQRKAENEAEGKPAFEMRVGIHTGPVVAGIVGVKKFQYDIWGDTVNTAARMESSGEVSKVNISEATYELVKDQFACAYRGEVEAKGKGMMGMYFVNRITDNY